MWVQAGDFKISLDRKKDGAGQMKGEIEKKATQGWTGEIKVENLTFKPSPEITVKYIVFVKRQELGEKSGMDTIEKVKGDAKLSSLKGREVSCVTTSEVTLRQQKLAPNVVFMNGGASSATDSIAGVWVKIFSGDTELMEYANPSTVIGKYKWE